VTNGQHSRPVEATTWIQWFETTQKCIVFELPFDVAPTGRWKTGPSHRIRAAVAP